MKERPITLMTYEEQRQAYIDYLHVCIARADWHGVSDAANDLRVLEAEHRGALADSEGDEK